MGFLKPKIRVPEFKPVVQQDSPDVAEAARTARKRTASLGGRRSTLLTLGSNVTRDTSNAVKTLLGG